MRLGLLFLAVVTVLSCSECLTLCVVPCQILMSVLCLLHAHGEHAQTQTVPSHVSYVSMVLESLRMDNSVMVRLLAFVCTGMCFLLCLYT